MFIKTAITVALIALTTNASAWKFGGRKERGICTRNDASDCYSIQRFSDDKEQAKYMLTIANNDPDRYSEYLKRKCQSVWSHDCRIWNNKQTDFVFKYYQRVHEKVYRKKVLRELNWLKHDRIKKQLNLCSLRYCNLKTNSVLPKAFCGGEKCDTGYQAKRCRKHWLHSGKREGRKGNPIECEKQQWYYINNRLPKLKETAATRKANAFQYKLFRINRTWQAAGAACKKWGGALASIMSFAEQQLVFKVTKGSSRAFWFSANDTKKEGDFRWADGSVMNYTNWAPHEPNDANHTEDCGAFLGSSGKWVDDSCNKPAEYICEKNRITQYQD